MTYKFLIVLIITYQKRHLAKHYDYSNYTEYVEDKNLLIVWFHVKFVSLCIVVSGVNRPIQDLDILCPTHPF